ncbi:hypothetical protein [Campylobacter concisus]|nr:hypothetical protein [Campylobacter concisus]
MACNSASALHAVKTLSNLKFMSEAYHGSKFSTKRGATNLVAC